MPAQGRGSRRVNLRLPNDTYAVVEALAKGQGVSTAGFVQSCIEAMRPGLAQLAGAGDKAGTARTVEEGQQVLEQLRVVGARARAEADRLDVMIRAYEEELRALPDRGSGDKTS